MMMSTRGVKFKFSAGEKVLCYEPDPTKAKVLYESKVLDLVANRDGRGGRKVCEYLIHFYGWNSSWDRYVREEFILPYTEENRELQAKLAEEAALSLKGKKKHKLPPLIKETLSKKMCSKNDGHDQKQPKTPSHSSSDSESSEDEVEKEINIEIPNTLKTILENDLIMITQRNKFVKLPCEKNVASILETYVKDYATALLYNFPPRNVKHGQTLLPEDVKNKLNLCKEAMEGLRVCFDFTLEFLLLYRQEKKQFYITGLSCTPVYNPNSSFKREPSYDDGPDIFDSFLRESEFMQENDQEEVLDELNYKKHETEAAMRNFKLRYLANNPNHCNQVEHGDSETSVHSSTNVQKSDECKQRNQSPKERSSKKMKTQSKSTSTRILRSSDKLKQQASDELSLSVNFEAAENNCVTPTPKISDASSEPTSPLRVTRKSGHNALHSPIHQQASPSSVSCDKSVPNSPTSSIPNIEHILPHSVSSNYFSSSNSSTHSTASNSLLGSQQYLQVHNSHLLQEIHNWRMVPERLYERVPASPSLIYGAHHLLRLFVKLPSLMAKMHIKPNKLEVLLQILENFLLYLADKSEDLFLESVYIDSYDVFPSSVLAMMY